MNDHVARLSLAYRGIHWPKVRVRIGLAGQWSGGIHALIDTGAVVSLATYDVGVQLGLDAQRIESSDDRFPVVGLGGESAATYGWHVDVVFGQNLPPHDALRLDQAILFFTRTQLPGGVNVLLGQHDFLERVELRHFNQAPHRRFVVRRIAEAR